MRTPIEALKLIRPLIEKYAAYPRTRDEEMSEKGLRAVLRVALGVIAGVPESYFNSLDEKEMNKGTIEKIRDALELARDYATAPHVSGVIEAALTALPCDPVQAQVEPTADDFDIDNPPPLYPITWEQVKPYAIDWLLPDESLFEKENTFLLHFVQAILADFAYPYVPRISDEAYARLCRQLMTLPRHKFKDSQTFSYIEADSVNALVEQAESEFKSQKAVDPKQADFDTWSENPYTKALQKSITEDYIPKADASAAIRKAALETSRLMGNTGPIARGMAEVARTVSELKPPTPQSLEKIVRDQMRANFVEQIVLGVAEIPDRNSPEDQPEMMLVTCDELRNIIASAFESMDDSQAPQPAQDNLRPNDLIDDALAKVGELGTVGAMKWLAAALTQPSQVKEPPVSLTSDEVSALEFLREYRKSLPASLQKAGIGAVIATLAARQPTAPPPQAIGEDERELPPLPEPSRREPPAFFKGPEGEAYYTADQMRAYARAAIAQSPARQEPNAFMLETLQQIVDADWHKWEELASPEEFVRWAKSRAMHAISKAQPQQGATK